MKMKKLIIEVNQNIETAKKEYNRVKFAIYKKISNGLFKYIKRKFGKEYTIEETETGFNAISEPTPNKEMPDATATLEAFLNGDYKKVDQLRSQERTIKVFLKTKFLKMTRGLSVVMFCNLLGIFITWRVDDAKI